MGHSCVLLICSCGCAEPASTIPSQKLISAIKILHQSRWVVCYAGENVGVLIEEKHCRVDSVVGRTSPLAIRRSARRVGSRPMRGPVLKGHDEAAMSANVAARACGS